MRELAVTLPETQHALEYSPENFTGAEPCFALGKPTTLNSGKALAPDWGLRRYSIADEY